MLIAPFYHWHVPIRRRFTSEVSCGAKAQSTETSSVAQRPSLGGARATEREAGRPVDLMKS